MFSRFGDSGTLVLWYVAVLKGKEVMDWVEETQAVGMAKYMSRLANGLRYERIT